MARYAGIGGREAEGAAFPGCVGFRRFDLDCGESKVSGPVSSPTE